MPRPSAESSPVVGASRPMTTVDFPSPLLLSSPRELHAESVRAPVVTAVVRMSKER